MKKLFTIALTFCMLSGFSQPNYIPVFKKIPIKNIEGKEFKFTAHIRTELVDDSAMVELFFRVQCKSRSGFRRDIQPIRNTEWKTFTFEGKVDSGAVMFNIGLFCQYSGDFYMDDVSILIKNKSGKWEPYYATGFEDGLDGWEKAKMNDPTQDTLKYFTLSQSDKTPFEGKKCLVVHGENIPIYGINNKIGKYADVNGIKLYYEIFGNGEPLVVLHGNGGNIASASEFYPQLSRKYKVIAIDSRGQGRSTDNDEELTYDLMASDINALLDQLHIHDAYVWGHSDGAILGLLLAMRHPEKVFKLLAYGANLTPDSSAVQPWVFKTDILDVSKKQTVKAKRLTKLLRDYPNIPLDSLSKIQSYVLIMIGDRDIIRPEHAVKMFQHIYNSQLCILPGCTHMGAWEKNKLFMMLLNDFFEKHFEMPDSKNYH